MQKDVPVDFLCVMDIHSASVISPHAGGASGKTTDLPGLTNQPHREEEEGTPSEEQPDIRRPRKPATFKGGVACCESCLLGADSSGA